MRRTYVVCHAHSWCPLSGPYPPVLFHGNIHISANPTMVYNPHSGLSNPVGGHLRRWPGFRSIVKLVYRLCFTTTVEARHIPPMRVCAHTGLLCLMTLPANLFALLLISPSRPVLEGVLIPTRWKVISFGRFMFKTLLERQRKGLRFSLLIQCFCDARVRYVMLT